MAPSSQPKEDINHTQVDNSHIQVHNNPMQVDNSNKVNMEPLHQVCQQEGMLSIQNSLCS
jgi:hypothetical protein